MMNGNAAVALLLVVMVVLTLTHALDVRKKSSAGMCRVAHEKKRQSFRTLKRWRLFFENEESVTSFDSALRFAAAF